MILAVAIGLIAIAVRFIAIDQPFVDRWSWRQSDVAAIARNYFTGGYHFSRPQIDWAGDQPGYVGTEFPILPFFAAVIYKVCGVREWIGRTESLLFFAVALPFFFLLVRETLGAPAAVWGLLFYGFAPLSVMTSRCFMPDMPSLSLSIVAICLFRLSLDNERLALLLISAGCMALSILIKIPSAVCGAALFYLAWRRLGWSMFGRIALWSYAAIALLPAAAWYYHAYRISQQFYPHHFFGAGGLKIEGVSWYGHIAWQMITSGLTVVLSVLLVVGVVLAGKEKRGRLFGWWLGAMVLFVFVIGYGNRHPWYQLPFVPIAAAFAGFAMQQINRNRALGRMAPIFAVLTVVCFIGPSVMTLRKLYEPAGADLRAAGLTLRQTTAPDALIVAADYGDPTIFYYAERKGWHFTESSGIYNGHPLTSADAIADLEQLRRRGATHLVFYSGSVWWLDYYRDFTASLDATATLVQSTPRFKIFVLKR